MDAWTAWQPDESLPPPPAVRDFTRGPPGWSCSPPAEALPSQCWDWHPVVAHWRDIRFRAALTAGSSPAEAWVAATPMGDHGYIDDSLKGTILLLIFMWFDEFVKYCKVAGILMSLEKSQVADALGRRW